jgi:hypothetical protein
MVWFVLCPVFVFLCIFSFYCTEKFVRLVGFTFQTSGLLCTLVLLNRTKDFFSYPSLCQRLKNFVKEFPFYKKKEIHGDACLVAPIGDVKAEGHIAFTPKAEDIAVRVSYIENYIDYITKWIVRNKKDVDLKINKIEGSIYEERNLRIDRDLKIENVIKGNAVGSVALVEISICYFFVGSFISSFAPEIERLFK